MKIISLILLLALPVAGNTLPSEKRKNGPLIRKALAPVQVSLQESSAVFYNEEDSRPFLYGTVVSEDGFILTKASDLGKVENYYVRVGAKKYRSPKLIQQDEVWDVALIKIEGQDLRAVDMSDPIELTHGTWTVSNGATERRLRRARPGIVSANKRKIPKGGNPVLGVSLDTKGERLVIKDVGANSGAEKAGLKIDDELLEIDSVEIENQKTLSEHLSGKSAGDSVKLKVKRGDETLDLEAELMAPQMNRNDQLSGGPEQQSERRTGFPMVIQHETMLTRRTVGGPLFTLNGKFVGMNIAAVNRVEAFAIPSKELAEVLKGLRED
ncbi:PDZ domain-containing protein [bacterium]|nr:PDZ domain-containing protein [bacterium]